MAVIRHHFHQTTFPHCAPQSCISHDRQTRSPRVGRTNLADWKERQSQEFCGSINMFSFPYPSPPFSSSSHISPRQPQHYILLPETFFHYSIHILCSISLPSFSLNFQLSVFNISRLRCQPSVPHPIMNRPEGRISFDALENPESRLRTSQSPPPHSSNIHGQSNVKNYGIRVVHDARPEGSGPINPAIRMTPRDDPYLPYMSNSLALKIKHTRSSRGNGVFTIRSFPAKHRIIYEGPIFTCNHPTQTDATSWKMSVVNRWRFLSMIDQRWLKSHFSRIGYMPMGTLPPTAFEAMDFLCFVLEYAFSNPGYSRVNIYRLASHINHACQTCANAEVYIEPATPETITVRLVRNVKKGQEILINYNRPSGNAFGCAVCGIRDGETSRFKQFWHGMIRLARGVPSNQGRQGPTLAQPFPTPSAKTPAHVVALAAAEAPGAVNVTADVVGSADAVDVSQSITDSATAEDSTDANAKADAKAPTDTVATVVPVGDADSPETRVPFRQRVSARWALFRARMT
ncbi:hypothetical protein V8C34DRAFT_95244 [Trichoderma compactum]